MKNRYILLFTLIFGLVVQTAGAMAQEILAAQITRTHASLIQQIRKYHPDFKLESFQWFVSNQWVANRDNAIGVPVSFVLGLKKDISSLHHEITHIKKQHLVKEDQYLEQKNKRTFASYLLYFIGLRSNEKTNRDYNELCKKHEWEADEGIPNNPEMLKEQMNDYKQLSTSPTLKEAQAVWNDQKAKSPVIEKDPRHPSFEERAKRFEERLNRLEGFNKAKRHFNNPKVRQFFGPDLPPIMDSPRPRQIVQRLRKRVGICEDYYPDVAFDMLNTLRIAEVKEELERLYCD